MRYSTRWADSYSLTDAPRSGVKWVRSSSVPLEAHCVISALWEDDMTRLLCQIGTVAVILTGQFPKTASSQSLDPGTRSIAQKVGWQVIGDWVVVPDADEYTDEERVYMYTTHVVGTRKPSVFIRCVPIGESRMAKMQYHFGDILGDAGDGMVMLQWQIDDNEASEMRPKMLRPDMSSVEDMYDMDESLPAKPRFVDQARRGQLLRLRVCDPLSGVTHTDTFSLSGFSEAIDQITCMESAP